MSKGTDWESVLFRVADRMERKFNLSLTIDRYVVGEIAKNTEKTLEQFNQYDPNAAKVAGNVAFWIKKLKPLAHSGDVTAFRDAHVNEIAAVFVGLMICKTQLDGEQKRSFSVPKRILLDWTMSLREHSHSPSGLALMYELLMAKHT